MKMLMVLTSRNQLGDTGNKAGFQLGEFAAPCYVFKDAGADITLASSKGGRTDASRRFKDDDAAQKVLALL